MRMGFFAQVGILARTAWNGVMRHFIKPEAVMDYAVDKLSQSAQQLRTQLAETQVARAEATKKMKNVTNQEIAQMFKAQVERFDASITAMQKNLINLEDQLAALKIKKTDLSIRSNMLQTQDSVNKLLGTFNANNISGAFNDIEFEIEHREAVNRALVAMQEQNSYLAEGASLDGTN